MFHTEFKAYKMRWLILTLFVMYSASNAFQWTQLVIITNILEKYYNVSTFAVSWTSLLFMVTYIPLIFPASWLLQTKVSASNHLVSRWPKAKNSTNYLSCCSCWVFCLICALSTTITTVLPLNSYLAIPPIYLSLAIYLSLPIYL